MIPQLLKVDKDELNNNVLPRSRSLQFLDDQIETADELAERIANDTLCRSIDLMNNDVQYSIEVNNSQNSVNAALQKSSTKYDDANTSDSNKMLMKQMANQRQMQSGPQHEFGMNLIPRALGTAGLVDSTHEPFHMNRSSRKSSIDHPRTVSKHRLDTDSSHSRARNEHAKSPLDDTAKQCSLKKLYRLPYRYPNDFDDISVEMENITKLLGSTIDLNRYEDTTPSTCSSVCHSRSQAAAAQCDSNDRSDAEISSIKLPFTLLHESGLASLDLPNGNGIFQNPW